MQQTAPNTVQPRTESEGGQPKIVLELLNVQSLLPKLPDIRAELSQRDADILCFTETNLKSDAPDPLIGRSDRKIGRKKSGGGVAIYVRENLQVNSLSIAQQVRSSSHFESL